MSTLGTLKQYLTEKIGDASTVFFTNQTRVDSINEAIQNIVEAYDLPQMMKKASITFTSGVAAYPTDYLRMVKLWTGTAPNILEFTYVPTDDFDNLDATNASYYWTIDYDTTSGTRKIYIAPNTTTSGTIRYVMIPTTLASDSDSTNLPVYFDDGITYWAASILFRNAGQMEKAQQMDLKVKQSLTSAYQLVMKEGGVKAHMRIRSVYEKYQLLETGNLPS